MNMLTMEQLLWKRNEPQEPKSPNHTYTIIKVPVELGNGIELLCERDVSYGIQQPLGIFCVVQQFAEEFNVNPEEVTIDWNEDYYFLRAVKEKNPVTYDQELTAYTHAMNEFKIAHAEWEKQDPSKKVKETRIKELEAELKKLKGE